MEMVCQWLDECKMSNEGGHMMYVTQLIVHSLLYCFVRDKSYSMFICLFSYYTTSYAIGFTTMTMSNITNKE